MSRGSKKLAAKRAAYEDVMKEQPEAKRTSKARWVKHEWSDAAQKVMTLALPACWPNPGKNWNREGSLDEIEARENAGQISLF